MPAGFAWRGRMLRVATLVRTWRSTKLDRGDAYLARHWYELALADGASAIVYFDRKARRTEPRWWLYSLAEPAPPNDATPNDAAPDHAPRRDAMPARMTPNDVARDDAASDG